MPRRAILVEGDPWEVYPSGYVTVYGKDEFGLVFQQGTGPARKRRFTRYAPVGARSVAASLAALPERQLVELFHASQPAWTAPEASYGVR